jgi:hypothetical protein
MMERTSRESVGNSSGMLDSAWYRVRVATKVQNGKTACSYSIRETKLMAGFPYLAHGFSSIEQL